MAQISLLEVVITFGLVFLIPVYFIEMNMGYLFYKAKHEDSIMYPGLHSRSSKAFYKNMRGWIYDDLLKSGRKAASFASDQGCYKYAKMIIDSY